MIQPISTPINTNFQGRAKKANDVAKNIETYVSKDFDLSDKARKLVKRVDEAIDLSSRYFRKNKQNIRDVRFEYNDKVRGKKVTITPVYQSVQNDFLLQVENAKDIERFLIRRDGKHYKYEKSIKTDHGFMTGKTFDSSVTKDAEMKDKVSGIIEEYVPKMVKYDDMERMNKALYL